MNDRPPIQLLEADTCPVSGLPVTRKPEWTYKPQGADNYRITFSTIGPNIIYTQVWGFTHLPDCKEYIALLEKVVESSINRGEKYILIEDYSYHTGVSNRAKDHFINYHTHSGRLLGGICCTRAAIFKIIVKMGRSVIRPGFPVEVVDGYGPAIRLAMQWQQKQSSGRLDVDKRAAAPKAADIVATGTGAIPGKCPISGLPVTATAEWAGISLGEGYSVSFRLIGDKILQTLPAGNSGKNGMRRLFEEREKFLESVGLRGSIYVEIKDYSAQTGRPSKEGRMQFTEAMVRERDAGNLLGYWGYGASLYIRWGINVGTKLVKTTFPVVIENSYAEAVRNAVDMLNGKHAMPAQTGYKRVARDEWQVELDGFTTRFETIGDDIIYNVTSGKMRKEHVDVFFQLYRKVLNTMILPGGHYFRIVNWKDLQGTTWEARQYYTEGTNSLGRDFKCAMSVGFGLNGVMKAIVNVSRPFVAFPIVVEDNFERALGAIEKRKKEMWSRTGRVRGTGKAAEENSPTASAYPVTRFDNMQDRPSAEADWGLELDGISCIWQLIGDDTLLYTIRGNMKAHHVKELFELYERVINESGLAKRGYLYQIADWGAMGPGTQRSRKLYIERFRQLNRKYPVRLYVIFGLSRVLRTIIALMGQFFPVRIMVAKSLEEAVSIIAKQRVTKAATTLDKEEKTPGLSGADEQQSIEKLLKFMGEINWDMEGTDAKEQDIPLSHPFRPLFEAVALIKEDFDLLLREKDNAERIIAEQNKFNRLRAEIWKTAAQKSIGEDELIQQLLDEIGPVFNVSRACFLRLKNADDASDLTCDIEWCNAKIKPTKGNKEPGFLIKHFGDKDLINITQQSALEMIPGPLRAIARPAIATMAAIEDLESTSLLAYRVDGKTRGWFSFDICRSQKDKPTMTKEMIKIAQEAVTIVSSNVAQKRAEEQVVEAYVGMEHAVLERTVELKSSQELAEKANRAKGDFLTNMSHEIRTPLNGIMGFAQIIARSKDVNPRERKQAEQITAECGKLLDLINQLLDLAKIEAGKMEIDSQNFSLQALMDDITSAFNAVAAEKNIGFTVSFHADVPNALNGDEMRLRQILINLIGNAIKFTREGSVSVSINSSEEIGNRVKLMFSVIDTGIGISKEKLGLIFESFTQADSATTREYGGSGLGTAICRQLVELMGGEIGAESELGKGSTFWFALPFEKASPAKTEEGIPESTAPPASLNHARVLVVEDYPTNQEVAKYLIESAEGVVTIAENGQVALEMFKEGVFDIILMDVQMPKMDGYEATREIRKLPRGAGVPIIGMTANVFEKDRQACLAAGMDDFLPKPLELGRFLSTVAHWLSPADMAGRAPAEKTSDSGTQTPDEYDPDKPVDVEAYVKRMGGNRDIAEKIIQGFIQQIPVQLRNIEEAIKSGDIETVGREAHSIKGGALNVFANDMMLAAKELEMQARSGGPGDALQLLGKISAEYERLVEYRGKW